jgi:hypothetical protein
LAASLSFVVPDSIDDVALVEFFFVAGAAAAFD